MAMPNAAMIQMCVDVVKTYTEISPLKITPAPIKPAPVTMLLAIRCGLMLLLYFERMLYKLEPAQMKIMVQNQPAWP
jgi:hypothetical protein